MTSVEDLVSCSKINLYSTITSPLDRDLLIHSWGQRSKEEIAFLDKTISYQVKELSEVKRRKISKMRRDSAA